MNPVQELLFGKEDEMPGELLGFPFRKKLFEGEQNFFKQNPKVAGMAAEDNSIILNPFSKLSPSEQKSVAVNEALRLYMRNNNFKPNLNLTQEQKNTFKGTAYENSPEAKSTIVSRILSGDPSAGQTTLRQRKEANRLLNTIQGF